MCEELSLVYWEKALASDRLEGPVLEIGSYNVNGNGKAASHRRDLEYVGLDIREGPDVDVVADITAPLETLRASLPHGGYPTILCTNTLEHVFDPIRALDNMWSLLGEGGHFVIVVPMIGMLHDYPADYWRILPDFLFRYFEGKGEILAEHTEISTMGSNRSGPYAPKDPIPKVVRLLDRFTGALVRMSLLWNRRAKALLGGLPSCTISMVVRKGESKVKSPRSKVERARKGNVEGLKSKVGK